MQIPGNQCQNPKRTKGMHIPGLSGSNDRSADRAKEVAIASEYEECICSDLASIPPS